MVVIIRFTAVICGCWWEARIVFSRCQVFHDQPAERATIYKSVHEALACLISRFQNLTALMPIVRHIPFASKRTLDRNTSWLKQRIMQIIKDRMAGRSKPVAGMCVCGLSSHVMCEIV